MQEYKEEEMETELAKCECCGFKEDCTQDYINEVKSEFRGKWLCGLCSEAVKDEVNKQNNISNALGLEDAIKAHLSFCRKFKANPAVLVAEGMRQMLRKRSDMLLSSSSTSKKYARSTSAAQVGNDFLVL
ncbi:putative bromodomain-containing protein-like [Heracleum sosnowskyi]|uniref:Bromodomain-containing protein-like n=1 Tax=Heracleum sosnowskyi TaxID=360622 RepID=A0AAD8IL70_9APIA|nr:putative bromodomain-containing protein-like [Heracleum sosnowskyi]